MARRGRSSRGGGRGRGRGDSRPTPHRQPSTNNHHDIPKLSLFEEARWMSSHRSHAFEPGKQLRNLKIEFVSAGWLEGTIKEKEDKEDKEDERLPAPEASPPNTRAMAAMTIHSQSPSPSCASSSEDEVVFKGRGATPFTQTPTTASLPIRGTTTVLPKIRAQVHTPIAVAPNSDPDSDSDSDSVIQEHFEQRLGGKSAWETNTPEWEHRSKPGIGWLPDGERPPMRDFLSGKVKPQDAAQEDYMQNVREFDNEEEMIAAIPSGFAHREMDLEAGNRNDWESDTSEIQKHEDRWDPDTLRDLDDLSTSSDVIDIIEHIISKRIRKSGIQYLVVYEGSTADDSRWLPASFLKSPNDKELVQLFEKENVPSGRQLSSSSNETDTSDGDSEDMPEIDDERLARILQKQEELGLSSDELLLYAADEYFDGPSNAAGNLSSGPNRRNKKRQTRAGGSGRRSQPNFPSASAMADALDMDPYNGFDVMDTERPSLRPRKKGRRGQMPPELEDSDLSEQLQAAWEADRATKRIKKAERAELRKQGLLGRKGKAPDLSVKYQNGVTIPDVIEQIRDFLIADMQTLSLPPMDAGRRATIHQFVNKLGLNSKSRGNGTDRFTVLSKTSRTREFDDDFFESLLDQKKFTKRLQRSPFRQGPKTRAIVSYKDGDTVGASAPELGRDNKGHALMEKMGWSKGMALGAIDNKGILQPIPHIVKTTKAGLQ